MREFTLTFTLGTAMLYRIESERGVETVDAQSPMDAAGAFAADVAGFDSDEPCRDPFSFTVDGDDYTAEIDILYGHCNGHVRVTDDAGTVAIYDQDGDNVHT